MSLFLWLVHPLPEVIMRLMCQIVGCTGEINNSPAMYAHTASVTFPPCVSLTVQHGVLGDKSDGRIWSAPYLTCMHTKHGLRTCTHTEKYIYTHSLSLTHLHTHTHTLTHTMHKHTDTHAHTHTHMHTHTHRMHS